MRRLILIWNIHFLRIELILAILIASIFAIWVIWFRGSVPVDSVLKGNRSAIYGTLASIFGSLLGFVITALSIIIGYSTSEKFEFLRKTPHYATLWEVLIKTVKALSLATVTMIVGLIFDRDPSPINFILCFNVFTFLLSLMRLRGCIWVLENVIRIIIK